MSQNYCLAKSFREEILGGGVFTETCLCIQAGLEADDDLELLILLSLILLYWDYRHATLCLFFCLAGD